MNLLSPAPRAVQRALPPRGSSGVFAAPPRGRGCRRAVATRASSGPTPRGARSPARPVVPHSLGGYHCRVFSGEATAPGGLLDPDDLLSQPLRVGARRVAPVFTCEQVTACPYSSSLASPSAASGPSVPFQLQLIHNHGMWLSSGSIAEKEREFVV